MGWDERFLGIAEFIAQFSKDRSTQFGSVIVNARKAAVVSLGWNGFPRGIDDDIEERHERPLKYRWTEHSERNAIYNAASTGLTLDGCVIYIGGRNENGIVSWLPCADCARAIIQCGIREIIIRPPEMDNPRWNDDWQVTVEMLKEAGVTVRHVG
jgi:dCMP deaminase